VQIVIIVKEESMSCRDCGIKLAEASKVKIQEIEIFASLVRKFQLEENAC